jgi:hypothetical protein
MIGAALPLLAMANLRRLKGKKMKMPGILNALLGHDLTFKVGDRTLQFTAEGLLMSFSLPNFFFHATTAYDIHRHNGAPLGKRDFIGKLQLKG